MSAITEHTATATACRGRSEIWSDLADPASWPTWNRAVGELELDGPFVAGTSGRLRPRDGALLPFRLLEVDAEHGYVSETQIAETVALRTTTRLIDLPDGTVQVSQHSALVGPAAEHFAPAFADALVAGVDATVGALAGSNP